MKKFAILTIVTFMFLGCLSTNVNDLKSTTNIEITTESQKTPITISDCIYKEWSAVEYLGFESKTAMDVRPISGGYEVSKGLAFIADIVESNEATKITFYVTNYVSKKFDKRFIKKHADVILICT